MNSPSASAVVPDRGERSRNVDQLIEHANPDGLPWDPESDDVPVMLVMSDNGHT